MFETDSRYKIKCLVWLVVMLEALMTIYLSMGSNRALTPTMNRQAADAKERARDASLRVASKTATAGAMPSLEMKENVDFLLTPALIVQEVLSEDVIKTYPSE